MGLMWHLTERTYETHSAQYLVDADESTCSFYSHLSATLTLSRYTHTLVIRSQETWPRKRNVSRANFTLALASSIQAESNRVEGYLMKQESL